MVQIISFFVSVKLAFAGLANSFLKHLILLLLIRGSNGGTTLILTRRARKKINPINSHNNKKHLAFDLVDCKSSSPTMAIGSVVY
jgi:hypothetical protein